MRAACALACALGAGQARADAIVFYEREDLRPGLCSALRIQLTGLADVRCQPDLAGAPSERIAAASHALDGDTRLAVLLEDDAHYARMLIVGDQPDRALLAIEPVEARPEPDVDRALALKVRDTFEQPRPTVRAQRDLHGVVELGGGVSTGAHTRAVGALSVGVRRARAKTFGELVLLAKLGSELTSARVREREWALGVGGRVGITRGRLALGPALDLSLVRATAQGESADGRDGAATRVWPRVALALDLRVRLAWSMALRFAPALELDPIAQRFTVEREVLALQRVRLLLPLSLVIGVGS